MNWFTSLFTKSLFTSRILGTPSFMSLQDVKKLECIFSNPAALKVFALQCDLFSLAYITVKKDEQELPDDPFLKLIKNPNTFQTMSQFLWDFMFWNMVGNSYCYVDSAIIEKEKNKMVFLNHFKMEWDKDMYKIADKIFVEKGELKKYNIIYRYSDGTKSALPLDRILISSDLSNNFGNWFVSPSRIDALYKVISNSEEALDAKNINLRYSGKFLVGSPTDAMRTGLTESEKTSLTDEMEKNKDKKVYPMSSLVNIKRFVENFSSLQLDQAYLADYFLIGNMYNIPRDVLEAYNSATYENQEKARIAHIHYTLSPKGNEWMNMFERHFMYDKEGKNIEMSWDHLLMMQVANNEQIDFKKKQIEAFKSLVDMGMTTEEANKYLNTSFVLPSKQPVL
jgi:hypothetical protein